MDEVIINLENIYFSYPENGELLFRGLSLKVNEGQRIGIVGENGSGKTTLFYIIMGLLKPQKGEVIIYNKLCKREEDFRFIRKKIGFLFQDPNDQLFMPTVEEDIAFGPFNLGKSKNEVEQIVNSVCSQLGISFFKRRVTMHLSWGQKRLVSLATALAMCPEILILDEPTLGIDGQIQRKVFNYLSNFSHTFLISSHDLNFLKILSCQIYRLNGGKLHLLK